MKLHTKILTGFAAVIVLAVVVLAAALRHEAPCDAPEVLREGATPMQAIRHRCYGGSEVFTLETVAKPVPADNEVLVRVHAAGVNPLDWHTMQGQPYIMRLGSGFGRPDNPLVGVDFAGTVETVGRDVQNFQPGDRVFGGRTGSFAEYLVVRADRNIVHIPEGVSFEEAAAVPIAAITALQAVRSGRVGAGSRVLLNGASGGVGTYAVQIAKAFGAEVTGVSSGRNTELVRSLGADHTIDYTVADFTEGDARYDVIIDNVGNHPPRRMRRALTPDGRLVMVTGPKANRWLGPATRFAWVQISNPFVRKPQTMLLSEFSPEDLAILRDLLASGAMQSVIDQRFTLAETPAALDYLARGRTRGKNVIVIVPDQRETVP